MVELNELYLFDVLRKVVVFEGSFQVGVIVGQLAGFQVRATCGASFEIVPDSNTEVLENVAHYSQVPCLLPSITVGPLDLVKTIKPDYERVTMLLHVVKIRFQYFTHFLEFTVRDRLHHVLAILRVVEERARLA